MTYTVRIPAPTGRTGRAVWLSENDRPHRYERARNVKKWREATVMFARVARLPKGLQRVRIEAVLTFDTRRHRDEHNYTPTLKAIVDGLGPDKSRITKTGKLISAPGHGLIPDDTPAHLIGPHIRISDVLGAPSVLLTIEEA